MFFLLGRIYSIYAVLGFVFLFLLVLPFQLISTLLLKKDKWALWFNYLWAWGFFILMLIPVKIYGRNHIPKGQFIFCANHFSYLDIPSMGLLGGRFKFFGKSSISIIPIFGWMYKRLHVTVDRVSFKSRAHALSIARQKIAEGYNFAFFPEGGVRFTTYPEMANFQDGPFRLAVEYQLPIVPVTMPRNHKVWPYDSRQLFFGGRSQVFVHEPIYPQNKTEKEIRRFKEQVRQVMQQSLNAHAKPKPLETEL